MLLHSAISLKLRWQPEHTLKGLTSHTPMQGVSIAGAGGAGWALLPKAILMLYIAPLKKFEEICLPWQTSQQGSLLHACARH